MPLHRFACQACDARFERLVAMDFRNPPCEACGGATNKLMPNRVKGGVKSEALIARDNQERLIASLPIPASQARPRDASNPLAMPSMDFKKDYADCSASERDDRWKQTKEAMTQWQTNCLVDGGEDYSKARAKADAFQTEATIKARENNRRDDGLT